jgi:hypothetical protein
MLARRDESWVPFKDLVTLGKILHAKKKLPLPDEPNSD